MSNIGSRLLYQAAAGLERALADVEADRLLDINAELIIENWDPDLVQAKNLPFLAWALGVNLWEDGWSEATKRSWLKNQLFFKSIRGTEEAIRMALAHAGRDFAKRVTGYELRQVVRPPQGFYATRNLTKAEHDAWIRQMPEMRIKLAKLTGTAGPRAWFAGHSFSDYSFVQTDTGPSLYGRRAVLRHNGVETSLQVVTVRTTTDVGRVIDVERVSTVGRSTKGFFANHSFVGHDFVDVAEIKPVISTVHFNYGTVHTQSHLALTMVTPTLQPIDPRFERVSDVGTAGPYFYAGRNFVGHSFVGPDESNEMLADRVYLLDKTVTAPMTQGMSFAGVSRVGSKPFHADLLIDLNTKGNRRAIFAGHAFAGYNMAINQDLSDYHRGLRAVRAAKALRDDVGVSFKTKRPLAPIDIVLADNTPAGQYVPNFL